MNNGSRVCYGEIWCYFSNTPTVILFFSLPVISVKLQNEVLMTRRHLFRWCQKSGLSWHIIWCIRFSLSLTRDGIPILSIDTLLSSRQQSEKYKVLHWNSLYSNLWHKKFDLMNVIRLIWLAISLSKLWCRMPKPTFIQCADQDKVEKRRYLFLKDLNFQKPICLLL